MILSNFLNTVIVTPNPFLASKKVKTLLKNSNDPFETSCKILKLFDIENIDDPLEARLVAQSLVSQAAANKGKFCINAAIDSTAKIIKSVRQNQEMAKIPSQEIESNRDIRRGSKGAITRQIILENSHANNSILTSLVMNAIGTNKNNAYAHICFQRKKIQNT